MFKLDEISKNELTILKNFYLGEDLENQFCLIGKVMNEEFKDCNIFKVVIKKAENLFIVVSKLGFSQLIDLDKKNIEIDINVLAKSIFYKLPKLNKIRLYKPIGISYTKISKINFKKENSPRQKFSLSNFKKLKNIVDIKMSSYQIKNNTSIPKGIIPKEIIKRFWISELDFLKLAHPVVLIYKNNFASICYSASDFNKNAEIDVFTDPQFRRHKFAEICCQEFIFNILRKGINPNWDAFINNEASINLAGKIGFKKIGNEYDFYTISKDMEI